MRTKRWLALALVFAWSASACAEYWNDVTERPVVCCEDRVGCQLLQMVMMGSFDDFHAEDTLSQRVLSAALPPLLTVAEEDFAHFCDEFGVDEALAHRYYYIALGNCLWADILVVPTEDVQTAAVRRVLLLFLDPESEKNGLQQMATIRSRLNDETVQMMAEAAGMPLGFIEYLLYSENWRNIDVAPAEPAP